MARPLIDVENLSKRYLLQQQQPQRYTALRDVLMEKVRASFKRAISRAEVDEFMALDDVSFQVHPGDRLGIIGRNGAGKSTLLKILSRITEPTKGKVTIDGRVASLLEVGTGFHPELTGRENIYLNGAILGMSKAEIRAKFDEIVAFAEVERFLDTPVKRYSSGMYVRLAFAVAAHLEPEILIVDEVLAVGDAAFQRKCLGKMESVAGEGRTVLFVSHQMDAVQRLCNKGLLLEKGKLLGQGPIGAVMEQYLRNKSTSDVVVRFTPPTRPLIAHALQLQVEDTSGAPTREVPIGGFWQVRITLRISAPINGFVVGFGISSSLGYPIRTSWSTAADVVPGNYQMTFRSDGIHLASGSYNLVIGLSTEGRTIQYLPDQATLEIAEVSELVGDDRILNTKSGLVLNQLPSLLERVD